MQSIFFIVIIFILTSCSDSISSPESADLNTNGVGINEHRVFITSETYNGNLGGLAGADNKCNTLAQTAGLVRTYKAMLGGATINVDLADRFTINGPLYFIKAPGLKYQVAQDDEQCGASFLDANGAGLINPIYVTELYQDIQGQDHWSGVDDAGAQEADDCDGWTHGTSSFQGQTGDNSQVSSGFYDDDNLNCDLNLRIVCISQ